MSIVITTKKISTFVYYVCHSNFNLNMSLKKGKIYLRFVVILNLIFTNYNLLLKIDLKIFMKPYNNYLLFFSMLFILIFFFRLVIKSFKWERTNVFFTKTKRKNLKCFRERLLIYWIVFYVFFSMQAFQNLYMKRIITPISTTKRC